MAQRVRVLCRGIERHALDVVFPHGVVAARLDRLGGEAVDVHAGLHHMRCLRKGRIRIAVAERRLHHDVAVPARHHDAGVRRGRRLGIEHRLQHVIHDLDALGGKARGALVLGHHHGHGLAVAPHFVHGHHAHFGALAAKHGGVDIMGDRLDMGGSLGAIQHPHHARNLQRARSVDPADPRRGVRAAHDMGVELAGKHEVVGVARRAYDRRAALDGADRLAHVARVINGGMIGHVRRLSALPASGRDSPGWAGRSRCGGTARCRAPSHACARPADR